MMSSVLESVRFATSLSRKDLRNHRKHKLFKISYQYSRLCNLKSLFSSPPSLLAQFFHGSGLYLFGGFSGSKLRMVCLLYNNGYEMVRLKDFRKYCLWYLLPGLFDTPKGVLVGAIFSFRNLGFCQKNMWKETHVQKIYGMGCLFATHV